MRLRHITKNDVTEINFICVAPNSLDQLTKDIDLYFWGFYSSFDPSLNYDIYLFEKEKRPEFFIRLSDAISHYEVKLTYKEYLNYLERLYSKNIALYNNKQLELSKDATPGGFANENAIYALEPLNEAVKNTSNELNKTKKFIEEQFPKPAFDIEKEFFYSRLKDLHK